MIIIIDNYDSFTYNLYQYLALFCPDIKVIRNNKITVTEVHALKPDGIILSPGPGRPEKAGLCIDLIRSLEGDIPLLGVCLGLQAITIAYGGQVIQATDICHGKSTLIFHHRQDLYQPLPLPFQAGRYHSLIADRTKLPDTLSVEAENATGFIMGLRHKHYPIYGVQFHPESILTPMGGRLLQQFAEKCQNQQVSA